MSRILLLSLLALSIFPSQAQTTGTTTTTGTTQPLYARLDLTMEADGSVVANQARIVAGDLSTPNLIVGEYLYEFSYRGEAFARGTVINDPNQRAADPDGELGHGDNARPDMDFFMRFPVGDWYGTEESTDLVTYSLYQLNGEISDRTQLDPARIAAANRNAISLIYASLPGELTPLMMNAKQSRDENPYADLHLNWQEGDTITIPGVSNASLTPLLLNGSVGRKKNIVVIGDGFTGHPNDIEIFNKTVDEMLLKDVLERDLYKESINAFNVFRINTSSRDYGVSHITSGVWRSNQVVIGPPPLNGGVVTLSMNDGPEKKIHQSIDFTSLESIADAFNGFTVERPDVCGVPTNQSFKARVVYSDGKAQLSIAGPISAYEGFTVSVQNFPGNGVDLVMSETLPAAYDKRETSLGMIQSDVWDHCWMHAGCDTKAKRDYFLKLLPDWDYVQVILNTPNGGGCHHGGGIMSVTMNPNSAHTLSHEMGHGLGLADEYNAGKIWGNNAEPLAANATKENDLGTIKWADFINPDTPLPTQSGDVTDLSGDVGAFLGSSTYKDLYRPSHRCRMKGSSEPGFCSVCYHQARLALKDSQKLRFNSYVSGDFNNDDTDDILFIQDNLLEMYRAKPEGLTFTWNANKKLGDWTLSSLDRVLVGDFDGDDRDDLVLYKAPVFGTSHLAIAQSTSYGFTLQTIHTNAVGLKPFNYADQVMVGDFDGDGRDDLYIYNGPQQTMTVLSSEGTHFTEVAHYQGNIKGWTLMNDAVMEVGDFDGDGYADVFSHSPSWKRMMVWRSDGSELERTFTRYNSFTAANGVEAAKIQTDDIYTVGDFNGDGKSDLYMINTTQEAQGRVVMLQSDGVTLNTVANYNDSHDTWDIQSGDTLLAADHNSDGSTDLYVSNNSQQRIAMVQSTGSGLDTQKVYYFLIGDWFLEGDEVPVVGNFNAGGFEDLYLGRPGTFGILRSYDTHLKLETRYQDYIHNYNYYLPLGHGL